MRKTIAILSILATSTVTGAALAQTPDSVPATAIASEPVPQSVATPTPWGNRLVLGIDSAFQNPLSSKLKDGEEENSYKGSTDMGLGALVRAEFVLRPHLNLTARVGYIYSLQKATTLKGNKIKNTLDNIPVWVGAKYFFTDMIYGGAELGVNMLRASVEGPSPLGTGTITVDNNETKLGANVGAGVLISGLDIRAQLSILSVGDAGESMGVLVNVGYNFMAF